MLDSIQNFLRLNQNRSDRRILLQVEETLLVPSKWAPSSPSNPSTTTRQKITLALHQGGPKGPPEVQHRRAVKVPPVHQHTNSKVSHWFNQCDAKRFDYCLVPRKG